MSKRKQKRTQQPRKSVPISIISDRDLLSIVIPVYGRFDLLQKCLDALPEAANGISYNVVLVDNNSPEEGRGAFYDNLSSDIIVIRNKENLGFPRACNQGAKRKISPLILMLNSDCILQPMAIEYMVQKMDNPKTGVVGLKLLFPEDVLDLKAEIRPPNKIQHVGLETNVRADFIHIFIGWNADNPRANADIYPYAVTGACFMTRRILWNRFGGFYEGYGQGTWEDIDFCMMARNEGYDIVLENRAVGYHYVGATSEKYQIGYPLAPNKVVFMQRWGSKLTHTDWNRW